jgi:hypothetical protein
MRTTLVHCVGKNSQKKTDELPDLNTTMICHFIENAIAEHKTNDIFPILQALMTDCHVSWDDLSYESKLAAYQRILHLCMAFGMSMNTSISRWIKDGNERIVIMESENASINTGDIPFDEEEEEVRMVALFDDFVESSSDTEKFLRDYDLLKYRERVLKSDYLRDFENLLESDIEMLMSPPWTQEMVLFSREEAEEIMAKVFLFKYDS